MKKFLTSLFGVLLVLGVICGGASAPDGIIALKGKTVNINGAVKADFDEKAIVEGELFYVYDCIATETVTHTTYGIKTGTDETNFYLVESYNKQMFTDGFEDYTPLTLIYATADKDQIKKLDAMADAWYEFESKYQDWYSDEEAGDDEMPEFPTEALSISGKITDYDDSDLFKYRDEYIESMGYTGDELDEYLDTYCVDMIIDDSDPSTAKITFLAGIGVAVIGLVGLILTLVMGKKKKNNDDIETNNEVNM